MDWSIVPLVVSHLIVMIAGVLLGRWTVVHTLRVHERDGHISFEVRHHDED